MLIERADSARTIGAISLIILASYVAAAAVSRMSIGAYVEPFPLGGTTGTTGAVVLPATALLLGLLLGWAVPGLSLALLTNRQLTGPALLCRAYGLGVAYVFGTGLIFGAITGHAPARLTFLFMLALPCLFVTLALRQPATHCREQIKTVALTVALVVVMTAILWPRLHDAALSGDGTEVYELSRSLEAHPLPWWDLEVEESAGRFGVPVSAPFFTGAFQLHGEMLILGRGELATRLPFVLSFLMLCASAMAWVRAPGRSTWVLMAAIGSVFVLWQTFYATNEPAFPDLASPPGGDVMTIALWLAGARELFAGAIVLGLVFMMLSSGTTYAGVVLTFLSIGLLWHYDRRRCLALARWMLPIVSLLLLTVVVSGLQTGMLWAWTDRIREEYLSKFNGGGSMTPMAPLLTQLLLMTAGLPLTIPFAWRRLSTSSRILAGTSAIYLLIILLSRQKSLHYLSPIVWLWVPAMLESTGPRSRLLGSAFLAGVFALSWPVDIPVPRDAISVGRESCIQGIDYEEASLAAEPIYQALEHPLQSDRLAIGKHTFVRYGLELGGRKCVLGLSRQLPADAVPLVDGPLSVWTTDPDRYGEWRLHQVRPPSSALFPRKRSIELSDASRWSPPILFTDERTHSLLIAGFDILHDGPLLASTARLLVPSVSEQTTMRFSVKALHEIYLQVSANGSMAGRFAVPIGTSAIEVRGALRQGWNIIEFRGGSGLQLLSAEWTR